MPYESTRVCLQPIRGVEGSDYINASFIDGYRCLAFAPPPRGLQPYGGNEAGHGQAQPRGRGSLAGYLTDGCCL